MRSIGRKKDTLIHRSAERQKRLKEEIVELDKKIDAIVQAQATKEALESFTEKMNTKIMNLTDDQKQYLINLLIERIEVTFGKPHPIVKIILRFGPTHSTSGDMEDEPKKSSNKPKMAHEALKIL